MYPLKVIVLAIAVRFVSCRPDGASPISCANMDPEHYNPVQAILSREQLGPSPYKLTAAWDISKKMVRVSVRGDKIQGFLLQGRKDFSGPAIGSFINIAQNPNATYQHCEHYPEVCELINSNIVIKQYGNGSYTVSRHIHYIGVLF